MSVHINFGRNVFAKPSFGVPQLMDARFGVTEAISAGAVTTIAALDTENGAHTIARVFNDTAATVYVSFNAVPDASTDANRIPVGAGLVEYFKVAVGDKASVEAVV